MTRRSRASAPAEAPAEAPAQEKLSDTEIMERIKAEWAKRPAPAKVSISDIFDQSVALVAHATGRRSVLGPRVSEQTAVKLYELALMWALNNRDRTDTGSIIPTQELSGGPGEAREAPEPNEALGFDGDAEQETN